MTDEAIEFACPRCRSAVHARYYGPCDDCRDTLRSTLGGEPRHVETEAFEPKLNVTPNAVALKDD